MATTIASPGIVTAANQALVLASPAVNVIKQFAYDMSPDFDVNGTVKVPVVSAGNISALNLAAADFEDDSGTLTYVPVTLDTCVKTTMAYTGKDRIEAANSPFVDKFAEAMANKLNQYVSQTVGAKFNTTDIAATYEIGNITKNNIAKLRNQCPGRIADTVLGLAPAEYADTLALFDSSVYGDQDPVKDGIVTSLYGFKAIVELRDLPSGVKGALINKDAIAFASRAIPVADESVYTEYGVVEGETGISLTAMRHGSAKTGKAYLNMGVMFGCKVIAPANIKLLV